MSNRAKAEFFVYEPGVEVPRDVTHILVPVGIKVLPEEVFRGFIHLKEVVLSEGLREIGLMAFYDCRSLERVHFPSTLIRIGKYAFTRCMKFKRPHFPDGLVEIYKYAFSYCSSLKRICLPSAVVTIGDGAFYCCLSLEVVILVDGIRTIGASAFLGCTLADVILPATLTQIGPEAFQLCRSLKTVKLCGGNQLIKVDAFVGCDSLNHIRVTPKSLIVTITRDDYNFGFATDGAIVAHSGSDRVVIASECFFSMRVVEAPALKIAITEILGMDLEWGDTHERLRELLAPHERQRKEEVTTLIELGLWKAEMRRSGGTDPATRTACRMTCKASVIIPKIVPFL